MSYRMNEKEFAMLLSDQQYTPAEIVHLFRVVCGMDSKVRRWTVRWMLGMGLPEETIEDVTVQELINEGFKPMNAFIIMDWLLKDPAAAKYALSRRPDQVQMSQEKADELRDLLGKEGIRVEPAPAPKEDEEINADL